MPPSSRFGGNSLPNFSLNREQGDGEGGESTSHGKESLDLLHKSEKLTISNFGFWILDFGLRDLGLLQEVY
jgi:hypothetical protein